MELSEIQKALADFEAKLKPVEAEAPVEKTKTAKKQPAPPPVEPVVTQVEPEAVVEPSPAGEMVPPCINKAFKDMIKALVPEYIGNDLGKPFLIEFLDTQIPECN
jgi:hypothetical protein